MLPVPSDGHSLVLKLLEKKNWQNLYQGIRTALRSREVCQTRVAALKKISLCAYLLKT